MFSEIIQHRARYPKPWFYLNEKLLAKDYIKNLNIPNLHIAKLIKIIDNPDNIVIQKGTVIKLNALSGCNIILYPDEPLPNTKDIIDILYKWLNISTFKTIEYKSLNIKPIIFIEEFLPNTDINWKFFCFKGKVICCLVKAGCYCRRILNLDYSYSNISIILENKGIPPPKPKTWDTMINIASQLSIPFDFVRVDLYSIKNKVYFGELTFTPCSNNFKILDDNIDKLWYNYFISS